MAVSNPPYVASPAMATLPAEVAGWEPRAALDGGSDGLAAIRQILADAPAWLGPAGVVVLEIGDDQSGPAGDEATVAGFPRVEVHPDLAGRPRVLVAALS
jgi:release factor glutamine methyltransferase